MENSESNHRVRFGPVLLLTGVLLASTLGCSLAGGDNAGDSAGDEAAEGASATPESVSTEEPEVNANSNARSGWYPTECV